MAEDFNGDGRTDLAICAGGSLAILLGDGLGGFTHARGSPYSAGGSSTGISAADYNGDGSPDIAMADPSSGRVVVMLGDGKGGLTPAQASPTASESRTLDLVSSDFDGDGVTDLAFIDQDQSVNVHLGNGDGTFRSSKSIRLGYLNVKAKLADFNADGRPDLAVVDLSPQSGYEVSILLGSQAETSVALTATAPSATAPNHF